MDKTKWIIFTVICVAILGALIIFNKRDTGPSFTGDVSKPITEGPIADHAYGAKDNKVVLIEYGDFQCPACLNMYPGVKEIKEQYKDKLTFVFRNLPLTSIHPNALAAATAAEAAGLQGKYFEMHDMLYENQTEWRDKDSSERTKSFEDFAKQLGLDVNKFKTDLGSKDIASKIDRDRAIAKQIDATSTPTFVINGQKVPETDSTNAEQLKKQIEDALKQAGL